MSVATQQASVVPTGTAQKDKPNIVLAFLQAPAVIVLFLWMIVPLLMTIYFSFIRFSLVNPDPEQKEAASIDGANAPRQRH